MKLADRTRRIEMEQGLLARESEITNAQKSMGNFTKLRKLFAKPQSRGTVV